MVKLRLRRKGRKKAPTYDIVAVDSRSRRDGDYLERVGYYDPMKQPSTVSFQHDRAIYWLNAGAQATDIVRSLLSADGVLLRRQMEFKGKTAEEIEAAIAKHKDLSTARYLKKQAARKARKAAAAAAAPAEEPAPAEEAAPAEEPMNSTEDTPPAEPSAEQSEG
ncbi:MAG: 30S ribosomal protein S16 [Candidatus Kapaibacteriota bacterium]